MDSIDHIAQTDAQPAPVYQFPEAFLRLHYVTNDGAEHESLWNSRDGVTPFVIYTKDRRATMVHRATAGETQDPNYVPQPGERIFVDLTPAIALMLATRYVERYWDDPTAPGSKMFATKEAAVAALISDSGCEPGQPAIVEVVDWATRTFKAVD